MELSFAEIKLDVYKEREGWQQYPEWNCFWSDLRNPQGLRLTPHIDIGRVWLEFTVEKHHSGIMGIIHGGIPFTILDGMMQWLLMSHIGKCGVTTTAEIS